MAQWTVHKVLSSVQGPGGGRGEGFKENGNGKKKLRLRARARFRFPFFRSLIRSPLEPHTPTTKIPNSDTRTICKLSRHRARQSMCVGVD